MSHQGLPTTDELFGEQPQGQLPTPDELFAPKPSPLGTLGQIAKAPLDYAAALYADETRPVIQGEKSTPALDNFFHNTPAGHVLRAFGQDVKDAWGPEKLGISDETAESLKKAGLFNDYRTNHVNSARVLIEGNLRAGAVALDAAQRGIVAGIKGTAGALQQTAEEIEGKNPTLAAKVVAAPFGAAGEVAAGVSEGALAEIPSMPHLARARALGVIGEGEEGFMGTKEPAPATAADRAEAVKQHNEHVAQEAKDAGIPEPPQTVHGEQAPSPSPEPVAQPAEAAAPDVHAIARQIDPATMGQYDALLQRQETYRQWINELGDKRAELPEAKEAQAKIDSILSKVAGVEDRLTKTKAEQLADARETLDKALHTDTNDMAVVRKNLLDTQHKLWDIQPQVRDAMQKAQGRMPVTEESAAAATAPEAAAQAEAAPTAPPAPVQEAAAATPKPTPAAAPKTAPVQQTQSIASDVSKKLVNAGRPKEEADAAAALVASHYEARAARFDGKLGNAYELYAKEGPNIKTGGRAPVKEFAQARTLEQSPTEIKGNPEGEAEDAAWRAQQPERTQEGVIKGAPPDATTTRGLNKLRGLLRQFVNEGVTGRFWYENSARRILAITRGNLAEAERLIGLVAIYSPQTPVFNNWNMAVKAYEQFKRGEPITVKTGFQNRAAQSWMENGTDWGGRKTNSFYLNLMHELITEYPDEIKKLNIPDDVLTEAKRATVDLWVLRAMGYPVDAAGQEKGTALSQSNKYGFAESEIQRLAGELNASLLPGQQRWLPHQIQAALWSAIKARFEIPEVKNRTWAESLKKGFATMEPDDKGIMRPTAPGKNGPARQGHMAIWRKHALVASPEDVAKQVAEARGSFGDAIDRVAQNVTWEAVPSTKIGADINAASPQVREAFTRDALDLITDEDTGRDLLAEQLGVHLNYGEPRVGAYEGAVNPNVVTTLVPEKPKGAFDATTANLYARAVQYIFKQDAVPFFRADPQADFAGDFKVVGEKGNTLRRFDNQREAEAFAATKPGSKVAGGKFAQGVKINFGKPLDEAAQQHLLTTLQEALGPDAGYTKVGDDAVAVINYRGDDGIPFKNDEDFLRGINDFEDQHGQGLGVNGIAKFGSEGTYGPVHDWAKDPSGKGLSAVFAGRPDLQSWLHDRQQKFDALIQEYNAESIGRRQGLAAAEGQSLFQGKRGSITLKNARNTIRLFKDADASTFIHETGHQWLEELMKDAADERAPPDLLADTKTVRDWLGVKEGETIPTKAHEKFARGFERYMMEGAAPNKALAGVFAKFKAWLTQIYQQVSRLKSPINDDIRRVFDRLVATPEREPIIAGEHPLPKSMADIHEADAETTPPEQAVPVANRIRSEVDRTAERAAPDVHAELPHKRAEAAGGITGENAVLPGGGHEAGPDTGTSGGAAPVGAEPAGGNQTQAEGTDIGAAAGAKGGGRTNEPAGANEHFTDPESRLVDKAGNIRLENLGTPEDVNQVIRETAEDTGGFMQERRGVLSDAQVLDLADALGMSPAFLNARKIGQAFNAEQIIAARKLLIKSATEVRDKMRAVKAGGDDNSVMAYAEAKARHVMIQEQVAGITAEAGRALRAFRNMEGSEEAKMVGDFLKDATGRTLNQLREEAKFGAALETPSQVSKYMDDLARHPVKNAILEYYINALISGPVTHMRYSVGNALNALWTPIVQIPIASAIGAGREALGLGQDANRVYLGEAGAQIFAMVKGSRDGWKAATEAFSTNMSPSLPGERYHLQMPAAIPGVIGKAIRIPSKSVSAIHSFFKSLRYEQNIQGLAYRTAMNEGLIGQDFANRVADLTARPTPDMIDDAGYLKEDAMEKAHFENVESATQNSLKELYMAPTKYDSAMGALNRAVDRSLLAKIIIPFMKIGSQITRNAFIEQTPLGLFSSDIRAEFAKGGAAADFQAAKMTGGIALAGITAGLAAEGLATGDGPEDPRERAVWLLNHRPNTITVGPITIPYQGLGSLGMLMRFSANSYATAHQIGHEDAGKLAVAFLEGATKSVMDENFMRGVKDMLDAVYHPEEYGESYLRGFITNWLPYSVGMSQVSRLVDPYERQVSRQKGFSGFAQSVWDEARRKVPFESETLPPVRDIFGEPIPNSGPLPNYAADPTVQELEKLQIGVSRVQRKIRGVPLTDEQYDDYSRIAGRYTKLLLDQDTAMPGWSDFPAFERVKLIRAAITNARKTAADSVMLDDMASAPPGQSIVDRAIALKTSGLQGAAQ